MRRVIGIDVHRTFGEVVVWEDGRLRNAGRIDMTRTALEGFGKTLLASDEVVVEATGNSMAVSRVLAPFVARVIIANPLQVKAIARAHVKTDKIDAGTLASLQAAGYLPQIWTPDAETERKRRLVARRYQVVRHRTRLKNEVHSILHAHLIPKCPPADLFNGRGRTWLAAQPLPDDERAAIDRHVRELDRLAEDLALLDRVIAQDAIDDSAVNRLMTITGVNLAVAAGIMAAIGGHKPVQQPAEAGELFWAEPAGAAIRTGRRSSRPHQQDRPQSRARHAGRGGLGSGQGARPTACVFRAHPSPARPSDRRGGRGPEAHRALLAFVDEERGLPVGAPGTGRHQDPRDAASSRTSATERQPTWASVCLQHQAIARPRDVDCRTGGAKLRALGDAMETTAKNRRAGASARQDKIGQPGGACSRCATLRHEVARARRG